MNPTWRDKNVQSAFVPPCGYPPMDKAAIAPERGTKCPNPDRTQMNAIVTARGGRDIQDAPLLLQAKDILVHAVVPLLRQHGDLQEHARRFAEVILDRFVEEERSSLNHI